MDNLENIPREILQYILKFCGPRAAIPLTCKTWAAAFAEVYEKKSTLAADLPLYNCGTEGGGRYLNIYSKNECRISANILSYIEDTEYSGPPSTIELREKYRITKRGRIIDLSRYLYIAEIKIFVTHGGEDRTPLFINMPHYCGLLQIKCLPQHSINYVYLCTTHSRCIIKRVRTDAGLSLQNKCAVVKEISAAQFCIQSENINLPPIFNIFAAFPNIQHVSLTFHKSFIFSNDYVKSIRVSINEYGSMNVECKKMREVVLVMKPEFDAGQVAADLLNLFEYNPALCVICIARASGEQMSDMKKAAAAFLCEHYRVIYSSAQKIRREAAKVILSLSPSHRDILIVFGDVYLSKGVAEGGISLLKEKIDFAVNVFNTRAAILDPNNSLSSAKLSYCGEEYEMRLDNIAAFNVREIKKYLQ